MLACVAASAQLANTGSTDSVYLEPAIVAASTQLANTGSIYRSIDQGEHWNRADNGFPQKAVINDWIVAKNNAVIAATEEDGIYISVDGLNSWQASNKGLPKNIRIKALATLGNVVLAGSYREGIFRSTDAGETWHASNTGLGNFTIRCFYVMNNIILTGTDRGIYASDTGGRSWSLVKEGMQINGFMSSGTYLFAATHQGILRSADKGKTWDTTWSNGATATLAASKNEIAGIMLDGTVVVSFDYGASWVMWKDFFPSTYSTYAFKITPASPPALLAPWKGVLSPQILSLGFVPDDLPVAVPFGKFLLTPFGVLVAMGHTGC